MNRSTFIDDSLPFPSRSSFARGIPPPRPKPKIIVSQTPNKFNAGDYIKFKYPFRYAIFHATTLAFLALICITLQTVLTLKNTSDPNAHGGYWAGSLNFLVALITIFSVCCRNYFYVILLAVLHFFSIVISIIGLVIMSILALSYYDECITTTVDCQYVNAEAINWTLFAIGIISTLLSGVFFSLLVALIGSVLSKRDDYYRG